MNKNLRLFCILCSYLVINKMIANIIKKNAIILFKNKNKIKWYLI